MAVIISDSANPKYGTGVATVSVVNGGSGYSVNDVLTISGGDNNATVTVLTVSGSGGVLTISRTSVGSGYSAGTYATTGGSGSNCTITITTQPGLSTVNGFYRVEAFQLNPFAGGPPFSNNMISVSTRRYLPSMTFANAGNLQGVVLFICGSAINSACNYGLKVDLQEGIGCTLTIASPGVVNSANHGLTEGTPVVFSTTGTLPTGITAGTIYYVRSPLRDSFNISATVGGSAINFSGTQSGSHTYWLDRATTTLTDTQMVDTADVAGVSAKLGASIYAVPFTGGTFPYPVDTTPNKWRFAAVDVGGTSSGRLCLATATSGNINFTAYAAWCDNRVSFENGDVIIFKDKVIIDRSANFGFTNTSGATNDWKISGVICRSLSPNINNVNFQWENPPLASYTLSYAGRLLVSARGGMQVGTPDSPIPPTARAIFNFTESTAGAQNGIAPTVTGYNAIGRGFFYFYGSLPSGKVRRTTFTANIPVGATSMTTAIPTGWTNGDVIAIGRAELRNASPTLANRLCFTVTSSSGTTVNFTPAIQSGMARVAGGTVCLMSGYGIKFQSVAAWQPLSLFQSILQLQGIEFENITPISLQSSGQQFYDNHFGLMENAIYDVGPNFIKDCSLRFTGGSSVSAININLLTRAGITIDGVYVSNLTLPISGSAFYPNWYSAGRLVLKNCVLIQAHVNTSLFSFPGVSSLRMDYDSNTYENCETSPIILEGTDCSCVNNRIWGCRGFGGANFGSIILGTYISPREVSGNMVDNSTYGLQIFSNPIINNFWKDNRFGTIAANATADIFASPNGFANIVFVRQILNTLNLNVVSSFARGTEIRFVDYNNITNNDRVYTPYGEIVRTGDSLTDTTVRTSGIGRFAIRFQSTSSTTPLTWSFTVPTGNIQNKTMFISVWCKINSANYWSSTHQLPRLIVDYDNGTTVHTQAVESTDWQLLTLPFTPATTFGQITVTLSTMTSQTNSNAFVYFDDFSVGFPPSVSLDLGGMDLWANALPITPPIAIPLSAQTVSQAVWGELKTAHTTPGTFGKSLGELKNPSLLVGGEIIL